jgi:hypothetical protein
MCIAVNTDLLAAARRVLADRDRVYWVVGGAGSGKTTVCQALSARFALPLYDMDAQIYGGYHGRFSPDRHPVNTAWARAENGLAWLLAMSWDEFDGFNRAALAEYVDLLAEDLAAQPREAALLVDGGICNPALLVEVIPPHRIVGLAVPGMSSKDVWEGDAKRATMKEMVVQLPDGEDAWRTFLAFDERIHHTILTECHAAGVPICTRRPGEAVEPFAERVACALGIQ